MAKEPTSTRECVISAAERLFAKHGIDAVSLREVNRASGAQNSTAVQYHFGDRAGVVRAILDKHRDELEARRHALLDDYEAAGVPDLRALAAALVRPLAAKLSDRNGGAGYLVVLAELLNRPNALVDALPPKTPPPSIVRWRALARPVLGDDAARLHVSFQALRFAASELARRAAGPRRDDRLFISQLIDLVAGILSAPISDETKRLASQHPKPRPRR